MTNNEVHIEYYSKRYDKYISVAVGRYSDGATFALDVCEESFRVHDKLCETGVFSDNSLCTNWQASTIHSDILRDCAKEAKLIYKPVLWGMSLWRWPVTFLFGCKRCRDNGLFNLKKRIKDDGQRL